MRLMDSPSTQTSAGPDVSEITDKYREYSFGRILLAGRIASLVAFTAGFYFIYQDIFLAKLPVWMASVRAVPIAWALVFLIISISSLNIPRRIVKSVYFLFLFSAMSMICVLTAVSHNTPYFSQAAHGIVAMVFALFFVSVGGLKFLLPVIGIPMLAMAVYMGFSTMTADQIITLSNPYALAILVLLFSQVQERLRYREFRAGKIMEFQHEQIKQKSELIGKRDAQLEREVQLSAKIQQSLLPAAFPRIKDVDFTALYLPMRDLGGDFYDFIRFKDPDSIGIFIGDVTGHGVPSALITSMIKTLLETAGMKRMRPGELLSFINRKMRDLISTSYLTAFYCIYNAKTRKLKYARAGHPLPYLLRGGGDVKTLKSSGAILGAFPNMTYEVREVELRPGDKLILYTDGLTEALDKRKSAFGNHFDEMLPAMNQKNIKSLVKQIHQELVEFSGVSEFQDDICIVGMEVR